MSIRTVKVYCDDCKYINWTSSGEVCKFEINRVEYNPIKGKILHYPFCQSKNIECDCPDYEPKWFKQILSWFTRRGGG